MTLDDNSNAVEAILGAFTTLLVTNAKVLAQPGETLTNTANDE